MLFSTHNRSIGVQGNRGTGSLSPLDASRSADHIAQHGAHGSLNGASGSQNGVTFVGKMQLQGGAGKGCKDRCR
eukprot:1056296-Heterocapsa_arctica.AAC.1